MTSDTAASLLPFVYSLIFILGIAGTIFWLVELVDVLRRQFADSTTKLIWVIVVLIGHFVGAVIYYFVGRSQGHFSSTPRLT
jgi:hypothetical protein